MHASRSRACRSGPCIGNILQPRLHGAMALIPTPTFGFAQTRTVGPHGCWDCLGGVPASRNVGFALGGPRNGRARQKKRPGRKWAKIPKITWLRHGRWRRRAARRDNQRHRQLTERLRQQRHHAALPADGTIAPRVHDVEWRDAQLQPLRHHLLRDAVAGLLHHLTTRLHVLQTRKLRKGHFRLATPRLSKD
jgi:hypothetical protein